MREPGVRRLEMAPVTIARRVTGSGWFQRRTVSVLLLMMASALVTPTPSAAENDPLEPVNRKVLAFNYVVDRGLLKPAAQVYRRAVPRFVRAGLRNVFNNLNEPRTVLNQVLQGKPGIAAADAARFVVNTTIGVGGLLDPATAMGLERHREDFGQTLGRWGMGGGPFLMLPILGPATLRDGAGRLADLATSPMNAVHDATTRFTIRAVDRVDARSRQLNLQVDMGDDPYIYLRDAYLERRATEIEDQRQAR